MLKSLKLQGVGPAEVIGPLAFAPRLNLITGDNGLGKSFLLDVAWWALTRTWARDVSAVPRTDANTASIEFEFSKVTAGNKAAAIAYVDGRWLQPQARPAIPGVVIYAGVDGSFAAWDPARNYWSSGDDEQAERIALFDLSPQEVWNGKLSAKGTRICNGLISDWVSWQRSGSDSKFDDLVRVLDALSPSGQEKVRPGQPTTLGVLDETEYPTLQMPYGQEVPLIHASAGMKRIAALAYLLVWTWHGHLRASAKRKREPFQEIIFLIDEIECHLHPQWQRRVVPALLNVMSALTGQAVNVQLIIATHSPLVLASLEPEFEEGKDAIFNIQLVEGQAQVLPEIWAKQGDVVNWLVSESFRLKQARSVEAEEAIESAEAFMRGEPRDTLPTNLNTEALIHAALVRYLPGADHFWPRWVVWTGSRSVMPAATP